MLMIGSHRLRFRLVEALTCYLRCKTKGSVRDRKMTLIIRSHGTMFRPAEALARDLWCRTKMGVRDLKMMGNPGLGFCITVRRLIAFLGVPSRRIYLVADGVMV